MKTFDIATKYLLNVDLSEADWLYAPPSFGGCISTSTGKPIPLCELPKWMNDFLKAKELFDADPENTVSNDYYRSVVFEVALYALLDQESNDPYLCWRAACDIVNENYIGEITNLFAKKWKGTIYPDKMMQEWIKYCNQRNPQPWYLCSTMTNEIFFTAYHYTLDKQS